MLPKLDRWLLTISAVIATISLGVFATFTVLEVYRSWKYGPDWIEAYLKIAGSRFGVVQILYDADSMYPVDATWTAVVHDSRGARVMSNKGSGDYTAEEDQPIPWAGPEWLGLPFPEINEPFYVCVSYRKEHLMPWRDSRRFCSDIYDPR